MLPSPAPSAALAWQSASTQLRMRELRVFTERDRIAQDLNDHVISHLFAVGLSLQGTASRTPRAELRQQLSDCVDDLENVIHEIRTVVFDLHHAHSDTTGLRQRLDEVIDQFATSQMRTTVRCSGPLSVVDAVLADHAEAVVREAVSNAVRHANATTLTVIVDVEDDLRIEVIDNGQGICREITASGLTNLRQRAEDLGGTFTVTPAPEGGTKLEWCAPLL